MRGATHPLEAQVAAEIAALASGPTALLGPGVPGLDGALLARVSPLTRLTRGVLDALDAERAMRAAGLGGFRAVALQSAGRIPGELARCGAETCIVDADAWSADLLEEPDAWPETLRRLLVTGRLAEAPPPSGAAWGDPDDLVSRWGGRARVTRGRLADPRRYLVDVRLDRRPPEPDPTRRRSHGVEPVVSARAPVTVVVPTAGRSPWLGEALASVRAQTLRPERVLVVADGCEASVRETVAAASGEVELMALPTRRGQAAAMNAALGRITTPFVAWLDDDDLFEPRKLELQLPFLEADPDAVLVASGVHVIDAAGSIVAGREPPEVPDDEWPRLLLGGSYLLGPTVLARVAAYRAIGAEPYDTTLPRAADHAMWFELAARGRLGVLRAPLARIRRHEGNRQDAARMSAMRRAVRATLERAVARWPLEHFFPALGRADSPEAHQRLRVAALLERAGRLLRVGLVDLALADVESARESAPRDVRVAHVEGVVRLERGELDAAASAFSRAAVLGAPDGDVANALGTIAWCRGDRGAARSHFERAAGTQPPSLLGGYNLCVIGAGESGREALTLARALLGREPLPGHLLSPDPPADTLETFLIRSRRAEAGLPPPPEAPHPRSPRSDQT